MKSYYSLARKELCAQKVTSLLILIAVVLSTMMTTAVGQSLGILNAMRQQQASSLNGNRYATFHQLTKDQTKRLADDNRISYSGTLMALGVSDIPNSSLSILVREYRDDALSVYPTISQLENGDLPRNAGEIALPRDVLDLLGFTGSIGDMVTLPMHISLLNDTGSSYEYSAEFILSGILKSNYVGYVSGTVNGIAGEGSASKVLPPKYQLYSTDIRTADKNSFQQTIYDLRDSLGIPDSCIQYNDLFLTTLGIAYDSTKSSTVTNSGFPFMAAAGILVGFLVLLAAGLVIYNILKIAVTKRIKAYGTLRAIGARGVQLYKLVSLQLFILCSIGIPLGAAMGVFSAKGITITATSILSPELFMADSGEELASLITQNSSGKLMPFMISALITLLFAFIAAIPAARYAAKAAPTIAMSGTTVTIKRKNRKSSGIRHFEMFYARLNLKRNTGRTVITILSLVMSITVFVALQGFSGLLDTSSRVQQMHLGDYSITNETQGFTPSTIEEIASQPEVSSLSTLKYRLYEQNKDGALPLPVDFTLQPNETLQIVGVDELRLKALLPSLSNEELQALKEGSACLIKNPIPYGEETSAPTSFAKGDTVSIGNTKLDVLGNCDFVVLDNAGFINGVQIIVFDTVYNQLTGNHTYSELYPTLQSNADTAVFEKKIDQICRQAGKSHWLSYQNTDQQLAESYHQIKMLAWGLILFIGLIGVLNIINTVYTNIHTRITEIGIQRAIGMSTVSLYKTFLWEGAYYGIIASVIGAVTGYICTIFVGAAASDTLALVAVPVIPILEAAVISILACLAATCIPLRKIAQMSIVTSIETIE